MVWTGSIRLHRGRYGFDGHRMPATCLGSGGNTQELRSAVAGLVSQPPGDRLPPSPDAELGVGVQQMPFGGAHADRQAIADLGVTAALGGECEYLGLPGGELSAG